MVVTPDADIYVEEVSMGNPDWDGWRVWPIGGPIPFGVDANLIYNFNPNPTDAELARLIEEGEFHAGQERARLGIVGPANAGAVAAPAAGGGVVAPLVPAAGGGVGAPGVVGGVPNLAGDLGNVPQGGGHAALVQALGGQDGGDAGGGEDARTLSISRDVDGQRFKEFRQAVQESRQAEFGDWPVAGR